MKNITNEKEILKTLELQAYLIEKKVGNDIVLIKELSKELSKDDRSAIGLNDLQQFVPVFLSDSLFRLIDVCPEDYFKDPMHYINQYLFSGDFEKGAKVVRDRLESETPDLPVSFIQRMKILNTKDFEGVYTLSKKLPGSNLLLNIGIRVNSITQVTMKMLRSIDQTDYMQKNYQRFAQLTLREREVITLLALGYQNNEIADQLFISKATVEQHRKNLKRKLEIKRFVDLIRFAQAFDLI
ncbi:MAG TPA: helix-turn-helix transcriptional regulator [Microscillaceae bacterium]|nr:helix-turn-helix transcriptional regulator [Microscillaceae bacterium]